jgi:hypothetical protein
MKLKNGKFWKTKTFTSCYMFLYRRGSLEAIWFRAFIPSNT